jgi:hypothetical protein
MGFTSPFYVWYNTNRAVLWRGTNFVEKRSDRVYEAVKAGDKIVRAQTMTAWG